MATARPGTSRLRLPFTPNVDERDENEAYILRLQLPEFKRQQVTVRVEEGKRVVKVTGERQAGDNQWFRFDETFPIPEICLIDKISVQLKNGVLSIRMIKQTTGPVPAPPRPKHNEQLTLQKGREEISAVAAVAVNDSVKGDSGKAKTTLDQKISSAEKKEIENKKVEKRKDLKTKDVGKIKNEETTMISTGTPFPGVTSVGRLSLPAMVSLAAAIVIAVVANFIYLFLL
ncbi:inactive protein RESTRICTED TEV MOVEMENT 2 [Cucumis melo]|uniref:Inactive protein RESTRICTED TEV MOVEMENT 2 n=1 Tax=Cucumis melo TaxID=3656 RepID=A0A1S3BH11_CUCME|nr:inactive protein RESTRICTED TEV MOVEMENT 2 [Cucumis melo]